MSNSAHRGKLLKIAEQIGEPIDTLVPRMVEEEGSVHRAAYRLNVAPNTIIYWMRKLGFRADTKTVTTWVHVKAQLTEVEK